jgi:hypothetical protein
MRDERGRLDALETGEAATSLRVVFSLSHARLSDLASGMFQVLGVHPSPEISVPAAAALAGLDWPQARIALAELCDKHLLTEHAPGRYTCHDLLRAYAAEAGRAHTSESERRAAVYRVLDYYLFASRAASNLIVPHLAPRVLGNPRPGVVPERISNIRQAAQWADCERLVLLAAIGEAAEGGYYPHAWELPWAAGWFFSDEESWGKLADAQEVGLRIARGLGDLTGAALAHHHLGWLRFWLGEDAEAWRHLEGFTELAARLSAGRMHTPPELPAGSVRSRDGIPDALVQGGRALRLYRAEGGALGSVSRRLAQFVPERSAAGYGCRALTSS